MNVARGIFAVCLILILGGVGRGDDYSVEVFEEGPPADSLSPEIASRLAPSGFVVKRGETRTVCRLWLCKDWPVRGDFQATAEVLYPFEPGELIGVLQLKRRGAEFRDRDVSSGVYTLRYAYQPTDGNHEGTFPTRDFLCLVKPEDDKSPQPIDAKDLAKLSAKSLAGSHPGLMCLLKPEGEPASLPAIRHNERDDWWIVQLHGNAIAGDKAQDLRLDLVVSGHARE